VQPRRCPYGVLEMLDAGCDVFKEMPSRLCQPDAAVASLEQENAKILFK
jgi:hypothetical protein